MSRSFLEARDRLLNGEGSLGARGYMEDAMRARGQLPNRPDPVKLDNAIKHFASTKHRINDLEKENSKLKSDLDAMNRIAGEATQTLSSQRKYIDALNSKQAVKQHVYPATRGNGSIRYGGNDNVSAIVSQSGKRSTDEMPGEVLPTSVPDTRGSTSEYTDEGRQS